MKKKMNVFIMGAFFMLILTAAPSLPVLSDNNNLPPVNEAINNEIIACTDITGWRYKTENNITYKRLYNYSTQKWIGDWIAM